MTLPAERGPEGDVFYPASDGKPMGETELHILLLAELLTGLRAHRSGDADPYIVADVFVYFEDRKPKKVIVPDLFAVRNVPRHTRRVYRSFEEGRFPEFILELVSESSYIDDQGSKKTIYAEQGALEYFLYDPEGHWLKPALQGFRLVDGSWQRLVGTRLRSEVLEMDFFMDQGTLRVSDLRTGQVIVTRTEEMEALRRSEAAYLHEAEARRKAEAVSIHEAEARRKAEAANIHEAEARRKAESASIHEAEARRKAEAEVQALREQLRRLQGGEANL